MKRVESLLILFGAVIAAYALDLASGYADMLQPSRLNPSETLWLSTLLNFVYAGIMLGLTWYALIRNPGDKLTRTIYLVLGLVIMVMGTPLFFRGGVTLPAGIPYRLLAIDPKSYFILSGSFIALIGGAGLIKKI
jgi:uncharacterized membrane protein